MLIIFNSTSFVRQTAKNKLVSIFLQKDFSSSLFSMLHCLVLAFTIAAVVCRATLLIDLESVDTVRVVQGQQVTLPCRVPAAEGETPYMPILMWKKGQDFENMEKVAHKFSNVEQSFGNYEQRVYLTKDNDLTIVRTERSDTGRYWCMVIDQNRDEHFVIDLLVLVPPKIIDFPPSTLTVNESQGASYPCYADGVPAPVVRWEKLDDPHWNSKNEPRTNLLRIRNASQADEGKYQCTASNDVARNDAKVTRLIVNYPPIFASQETVHRSLTSVQMTCQVMSRPLSTISWFRAFSILNWEFNVFAEEELLGKSGKYKITTRPVTDQLVKSVLTIEDIEPVLDFGTYVCVPANPLGSAEMEMKLVGNPGAPEILSGTRSRYPDEYKLIFKSPPHDVPVLEYSIKWRKVTDKSVHAGVATLDEARQLQEQANRFYPGRRIADRKLTEKLNNEVELSENSQTPKIETNSTSMIVPSATTNSPSGRRPRLPTWVEVKVIPGQGQSKDEIVYIISNLEKGTPYEVIVCEINEFGTGEPSAIIFFTNTAPSANPHPQPSTNHMKPSPKLYSTEKYKPLPRDRDFGMRQTPLAIATILISLTSSLLAAAYY